MVGKASIKHLVLRIEDQEDQIEPASVHTRVTFSVILIIINAIHISITLNHSDFHLFSYRWNIKKE